jgi:hypothetical protein
MSETRFKVGDRVLAKDETARVVRVVGDYVEVEYEGHTGRKVFDQYALSVWPEEES